MCVCVWGGGGITMIAVGRKASTGSTDPERDHGGEVEGRDAGHHPEWQAVRHGVHVLGDALQCLTQLQRRDAAAMLHHLCSIQQKT